MNRIATKTHSPAWLAAAGALFLATPAPAAQIPWSEEPLSYTVIDQDLRDLLAEIGMRLGVRVQVSPAVKARVKGRLAPAPPQEFLTRLAAIYGFEWFYDGGILWISAPSENQNKMLQLESVTVEQVATVMDELGASDPRFPLRASSQAGIMVVNGPPQFVSMAEMALQALQQRIRPTRSNGVIVFRG